MNIDGFKGLDARITGLDAKLESKGNTQSKKAEWKSRIVSIKNEASAAMSSIKGTISDAFARISDKSAFKEKIQNRKSDKLPKFQKKLNAIKDRAIEKQDGKALKEYCKIQNELNNTTAKYAKILKQDAPKIPEQTTKNKEQTAKLKEYPKRIEWMGNTKNASKEEIQERKNNLDLMNTLLNSAENYAIRTNDLENLATVYELKSELKTLNTKIKLREKQFELKDAKNELETLRKKGHNRSRDEGKKMYELKSAYLPGTIPTLEKEIKNLEKQL